MKLDKLIRKLKFTHLKFLIKIFKFVEFRIDKLVIELNDGIHPKQRIMNYYQYFLENIKENTKVLDIGCGFGYVAYHVSEKAKEVLAIDINKNLINKAKSRFNRKNIEYIVGDVTQYNFNKNFDYVILSNVLEHIKNRQAFLLSIKKITNYLLLRVPMINRSWFTLYIKELGLDYRSDKGHYIEYTVETLKEELKSVGFELDSYEIKFGEIYAKARSRL